MYKRRIILSIALSSALISASLLASGHDTSAIFAGPEKSVDTGVKIRPVLNGAISRDTIAASKQASAAVLSVNTTITTLSSINPLLLTLASKQVELSMVNDAVMINNNFERMLQ
tara:strand:- start:351 stop:692 length:342 start_codon:yes stop_codon:yes gene_type:complete